MTQALTNVLLMDAVVACLDTQKPIIAASKLAHLDKIRQEGLGVTLVLRHFLNENTLQILTIRRLKVWISCMSACSPPHYHEDFFPVLPPSKAKPPLPVN